MQTALLPIMRDYLVRFQQTAIKETGRRPLCWLRSPKDEALVIPGCRRPGYAFWQPISWKDDQAPLGEHTAEFHQSIVDYLSLCQFLEIRFFLPVAGSGSPYSFLYRRVFEAERNTDSAPPEQKFQEALDYAAQRPELPPSFCMAATCDEGEKLLLMLPRTVTYTDGVEGAAFADQVYTVRNGSDTPAYEGSLRRKGYVVEEQSIHTQPPPKAGAASVYTMTGVVR